MIRKSRPELAYSQNNDDPLGMGASDPLDDMIHDNEEDGELEC